MQQKLGVVHIRANAQMLPSSTGHEITTLRLIIEKNKRYIAGSGKYSCVQLKGYEEIGLMHLQAELLVGYARRRDAGCGESGSLCKAQAR